MIFESTLLSLASVFICVSVIAMRPFSWMYKLPALIGRRYDTRFQALERKTLMITGASHGIGREMSRQLILNTDSKWPAFQTFVLLCSPSDLPELVSVWSNIVDDAFRVSVKVIDTASDPQLENIPAMVNINGNETVKTIYIAAVDLGDDAGAVLLGKLCASLRVGCAIHCAGFLDEENPKGMMNCHWNGSVQLMTSLRSQAERFRFPTALMVIGSSSFLLPTPGAAAYGASKAAVSQYLLSTSLEEHEDAPHSMIVKCVEPGYVQTSLYRNLQEDDTRFRLVKLLQRFACTDVRLVTRRSLEGLFYAQWSGTIIPVTADLYTWIGIAARRMLLSDDALVYFVFRALIKYVLRPLGMASDGRQNKPT